MQWLLNSQVVKCEMILEKKAAYVAFLISVLLDHTMNSPLHYWFTAIIINMKVVIGQSLNVTALNTTNLTISGEVLSHINMFLSLINSSIGHLSKI